MTNDLANAIVAALGDTPLDRKTLHALAAVFDEILVTEERRIVKDRTREAARAVAMTKDKPVDPIAAVFDEIIADRPANAS